MNLRRPGLLISAASLLVCCFCGTASSQHIPWLSRPVFDTPTISHGVAWADVNGDGRVDLYITNAEIREDETSSPRNGRNVLLINQGDWQFATDAQNTALATGDPSQAAIFSDVDGDGLLDLSVFNGLTNPLIETRNTLYYGLDGGGWTEVESSSWSPDTQANVSGTWADYDGDGDLDLFIIDNSPSGSNTLLRNDGGRSFTPVADTGPSAAGRPGRMATWIDVDEDGDLDLVLVTFQFGNADSPPVKVYLNRLVETGSASFDQKTSGDALVEDLTPEASMGISAVDIDNDGDRDIHITQGWGVSRDLLYRNTGGGQFERVEGDPLVMTGGYASSSCWGDFDNDADLDVFVSTFYTFSTTGRKDRLYLNDGSGNFSAADGADATSAITQAKGCALADIDNDGDLDLAVATGHLPSGIRAAGPELNRVYENDLQSGAHWIRIRLAGAGKNTEAIGARIQVEAEVGGKPVIQTRWIEGGPTGDRGQNEKVAHFGLGDASAIDRVVVTWPSGAVDEWSDLAVDTVHLLSEETGATGIESLPSHPAQFSVYPNPARGQITVSYELERAGTVGVRILDLLGRTVFQDDLGFEVAGEHRRTIDISNLSAGTFVAQLISDRSAMLDQRVTVFVR